MVAFALYAILTVIAFLTLHGIALALALVIVLGLALKTLVDILRRRIQD